MHVQSIITYINNNNYISHKSRTGLQFDFISRDLACDSFYKNISNIKDLTAFQPVLEKVKNKFIKNPPNVLIMFSPFKSYKDYIEDYFNVNCEKIKIALNLLGERSFEHIFDFKMSAIDDLFIDLKSLFDKLNPTERDNLIKYMNVENSIQYKKLSYEIKKYKTYYLTIQKGDNKQHVKQLEKLINTKTKMQREMVLKAYTDPEQKIDTLQTLSRIYNPETMSIEKLLNDKDFLNDYINKKIFYLMSIDYDKSLSDKLEITNSVYKGSLLKGSNEFYKNFTDLAIILQQYPDKNTTEILNNLPQNIKTKEIFEQNGFNYEKWINFDENSFAEITTQEGKTYKIRKVPMNNIGYSLFLGNHASCCTAVGRNSTMQATAPNYIKNKMVSAIEILDGDSSIGNSMCYAALVDGKPALLLDNISIKGSYINDSEYIKDGIIKYSNILTQDIYGKKLPVYLASLRQSIDMPEISYCKKHTVNLLGTTGNDYVYVDYDTYFTKLNGSAFKRRLFKLYPRTGTADKKK